MRADSSFRTIFFDTLTADSCRSSPLAFISQMPLYIIIFFASIQFLHFRVSFAFHIYSTLRPSSSFRYTATIISYFISFSRHFHIFAATLFRRASMIDTPQTRRQRHAELFFTVLQRSQRSGAQSCPSLLITRCSPPPACPRASKDFRLLCFAHVQDRPRPCRPPADIFIDGAA